MIFQAFAFSSIKSLDHQLNAPLFDKTKVWGVKRGVEVPFILETIRGYRVFYFVGEGNNGKAGRLHEG